jgi:hypothetical protein
MTRIFILLAVIFGGAVVALLLWITSEAEEQNSVKKELLETGRVKVKRPPREGPIGPRPGGMAREILRIEIPSSDPRRTHGGPCVLSLRANNTYFRRPALDGTAFLRGALSRADTDALLARATECGTAAPPEADGFVITISADGPPVRRAANETAILSLLEGLGRHERPFAAEAVRLGLEAVETAPEGLDPIPWPLSHQDPAELLAAPQEVEITDRAAKRLAEAAHGGAHFTHGDPARLYRISYLELVLP